jgi:hypothetical protein
MSDKPSAAEIDEIRSKLGDLAGEHRADAMMFALADCLATIIAALGQLDRGASQRQEDWAITTLRSMIAFKRADLDAEVKH